MKSIYVLNIQEQILQMFDFCKRKSSHIFFVPLIRPPYVQFLLTGGTVPHEDTKFEKPCLVCMFWYSKENPACILSKFYFAMKTKDPNRYNKKLNNQTFLKKKN